jgi:glycosyltransferase involved in cell wall biosynthesis
MQKPLVSVIMPAYNSERYIASAIASVQNQAEVNWEMIIVDDCSTDNTVAIVEDFAKADPRIKLHILSQNSGTGAARNFATELAQGKYIAFLDSDDMWKPKKLAVQLQFMSENNLPFTFSFYEWMDEEGNLFNKKIEAPQTLTYKQLFWSNWVGNLTAIYDVDYFGKIPISSIRKRQDWMLWLTLLKKIGKTSPVPKSLAYYRIRKSSVSSSKWMLLKHNYNVYRKFHKFNPFRSLVCLFGFLITHFLIRPKYSKSSR